MHLLLQCPQSAMHMQRPHAEDSGTEDELCNEELRQLLNFWAESAHGMCCILFCAYNFYVCVIFCINKML